jgi:exopolysaccharide production protein ExoY
MRNILDPPFGPRAEESASVLPLSVRIGRSRERHPIGGVSKRILDSVLAFLALFALLPVMLGIVLLIRSNGHGPVFFGHERIGYGGRTYRCWKFRTMVTDSAAVLVRHLADNPAARAEWDATAKLRDDPRVTSLGRVLRRTSLDELPQLFNVLIGEMSLVGPRPVVASELARYGEASADYLSARPGLTGLWQISGRSDTGYAQRVALDSAYVRGWTLAEDIRIMLRTVPVVLKTGGAY